MDDAPVIRLSCKLASGREVLSADIVNDGTGDSMRSNYNVRWSADDPSAGICNGEAVILDHWRTDPVTELVQRAMTCIEQELNEARCRSTSKGALSVLRAIGGEG